MIGIQLSIVEKGKDLGIIMTSDLKSGLYCTEVVKSANKLVSFKGRVVEFKSDKNCPDHPITKRIEKR